MKVIIRAEMVANVLEVTTSIGANVSIGDTLLLLESMKMEIPVLTEHSGEVIEVSVIPGDVIQEGDPLIVINASEKIRRK